MRPVASLAFLVLAATAHAQSPDSTNACFGFSFGRWTPPLDWGKAGHTSPPRQVEGDAGAARGGGRRSWAADHTDDGRVEMMLFPAWWPVGVFVSMAGAGGDTLRGTATALVADGRVAAPVARVAALRVPCGAGGVDRPVPPADDPAPPAPARRTPRAARRP